MSAGAVKPWRRYAFGAVLLSWYALCGVLDRLHGTALDDALAIVRAQVLAWPSSLRRIGYRYKDTTSAWLKPLFDGTIDPRLSLVVFAKIEHHIPFKKEGELFAAGDLLVDQYGVVCALARCLDPAFRPPDTLLMSMSEVRSANGCGGGPTDELPTVARKSSRQVARWARNPEVAGSTPASCGVGPSLLIFQRRANPAPLRDCYGLPVQM